MADTLRRRPWLISVRRSVNVTLESLESRVFEMRALTLVGAVLLIRRNSTGGEWSVLGSSIEAKECHESEKGL